MSNKVINNVKVYDLAESLYASGYPMMAHINYDEDFDACIVSINKAVENKYYDNPYIKRGIKLATAKGGGHNQFLTGIVVNFDLTLSNKAWVEAERYRFLNFVSSQSTMHRIKMLVREPSELVFNKHVDARAIELLEEYVDKYEEEPTSENFLNVLYNIPSGLKLTARMTTNYRCLMNIYEQRRTHRLTDDWGKVCDWIETLPLMDKFLQLDK